ncbi:hypothetical protein TrST_g4400 [Triparma strigata]|uniref:Sulfotransferase n=1 Tax=Triparma strigata TaxID=1606541 RepID=A0A9W7E897_9STRA|nr:hypothetical protein TrST_g4400 [Triparma strigata]
MDQTYATAIVGLVIGYYVIKIATKPKFGVPPRISWKARLGNLLLSPLAYFQISPVFKPLSLKSLKKAATKMTKGLTDFGDTWYETPYTQTMEMVNTSTYSPIGKAAANDFFLRRLIARLRLIDHLKSPSISPCLQKPVTKPLFVVGLPRTGTTFLHRLLSLDPSARSPRTYELFDPVPRYPDPIKDKKSRVKFVQSAIDKLLLCVPHFSGIHEVGADLPEECMMSLGCDIPMLFATFHVLISPPYLSFDWESGQAYKNYKKVLQLLQHQEKSYDKRWTLKCPVHLGLLPFLSEGFPDATVVWTHREPKQAIGSLCSFVRATQDMHEGSGYIDLEKVGADVNNFGNLWIKRADDFLKSPESKGHKRGNVMYTELIKNPVGTVKKLYGDLGYEFTPEYEKLLKEYVEENNREREALKKSGAKKLHSYELKDFNLDEEKVAEGLAWYKEKYFK